MIYTGAELLLMGAAVLSSGAFLRKGKYAHALLLMQSYLTWAAFGIYVIAHVIADTRLAHVNAVGAGHLTTFFRVSAIWSDHDGSWFLWVALVGFLVPLVLPHRKIMMQKIMAIQSANLVYLLAMANPFTRTHDSNLHGVLNPLLHDISLGIHPPILYTGTLLLLVSCIGLMRDPTDKNLMFGAKLGWAITTLGITLGSIWAYYELGWGGWWFWDPVENVSLVPWLLGVILIHPAHKMHTRIQMTSCAIVSVILAGVWVVRSGLVQSVHSFAHDSAQSVALGIICVIQLGISVWGLKLHADHGQLRPWQRWHSWSLGSVVAVLLATIYVPVVMAVTFGEMFGFTPAFFVWVVSPMLLMGCAGAVYFVTTTRHVRVHAFLMAALIMLGGYACAPHHVMACVSIGVGVAIAVQTLRGIRQFSRALLVAHGGLGLMLMGIGLNAVTSFDFMQELDEKPVFVGRARVQFIKKTNQETPEYTEKRAQVQVKKNGLTNVLIPRLKVYKPALMTTSTAALHPYDLGLMMVNFGSPAPANINKDKHKLHIYVRVDPFVCVIWLGALMMGLGIMMHLFRRGFVRSGNPPLR